MNALVVYDSQFGHTETIARAIASVLAEHGAASAVPVAQAVPDSLAELDLLVLGGPTQYHEATPEMLAWVEQRPSAILSKLPAAAFDTRYRMSSWLSGSAARAVARALKQRGGDLLVPPVSFFVVGREGPLEDGEPARAAIWAQMLCDRLSARRSLFP